VASEAGRFEFEAFTELFQHDFALLGFSPIGPDGADSGAVVISWEHAVDPSVITKDALLGIQGEIAVLRFFAVGGPFRGKNKPRLTMAELSIIHVHHKDVAGFRPDVAGGFLHNPAETGEAAELVVGADAGAGAGYGVGDVG
jgi:hypothetical protein